MGACTECDGLGVVSFFDPLRIVAFPHLSLASGAVKGWDRRNHFFYQMLQSLALHYGFELDTQFDSLPQRIQDIILYGSGKEEISFKYLGEKGGWRPRKHAFEGILKNLERRYRETDSITVREELAKFLNNKPCPKCEGTRLRLEARHVLVADKAIFEVGHWPLKDTLAFFELASNWKASAPRLRKESSRKFPPAWVSSTTSDSTI